MDRPGMLHLYWGDGKGKTTAAMGLALRALGRGWQVTVVQFFKDGTSGETEPLRQLGARVLACPGPAKFSWEMTPAERERTRAAQDALLEEALSRPCDLLVLDEACGALEAGLLDEALLKRAALDRPAGREVVLTGRTPAPWMEERADYITRMEGVRHPFDGGAPARRGIEY